MGMIRRHPALVPLLLLFPGLVWLVSFYLAPNIQMFASSFWSGTLESGFSFSFSNWTNYTDALGKYQQQYARSIQYGFAATLICFAIAFPLAYFIAFKAGRARSALLFLVVAPFFTSYLLRTIGWRTILGDDSIILGPLKAAGFVDPAARFLDTPFAVIAGIAYNFVPFMILPIYVSLEKIDRSSWRRRKISMRAAGVPSVASPSRSRCLAFSRALSSPSSLRLATSSTLNCSAIQTPPWLATSSSASSLLTEITQLRRHSASC